MINNQESNRKNTQITPPPMSIRRRMAGRDISESHRVSTPLELLFDLSSVVAVAAATENLHQRLLVGDFVAAVTGFLLSFFAIWWPWASFTWFSSAYDTDDVPFRFATMMQITGVLFIAAGLADSDPHHLVGVVGFSLMRVALAVQWMRASSGDSSRSKTCLRYAFGICVLQILWIARAIWISGNMQFASFLVLAILELTAPVLIERSGETPWHAHHIAERYGLFTIILLGECMASATAVISTAIGSFGWSLDLMAVSFGTIGLLLGLWWAYFLVPFAQVLHFKRERGYIWAFGHIFVFAAMMLLGAAFRLVADTIGSSPIANGHAGTTAEFPQSEHFAIVIAAVASTLFLMALWWLGRTTTRRRAQSWAYVFPQALTAGIAIIAQFLGISLSWTLAILAFGPTLMVGWIVYRRHQRPEDFAVQ